MLTRVLGRHTLLWKVALTVFLCSALYMFYGYHIGAEVRQVLLSALESHSYAENNPYADMISDEQYYRLMAQKYGDFDEAEGYSHIRCKQPWVLHWFAGAYVWSSYDYTYYQNGEAQVNLTDVTVRFTCKQQAVRWRIVDCRIGAPSTGA